MVSFEVFGDSNIARSWKSVASENDRLKGSVLRQTTTQISLRDSLKTVAQSTRFIIVAALTNPLTRIKFSGIATLEPAIVEILEEIFDYLVQTINSNPDLTVSFRANFFLKLSWIILLLLSLSNVRLMLT
jgi:hypothetical protein